MEKLKPGTEVADDELGGVARTDGDDWGANKVNAEEDAAGKVGGVAKSDEELAGSDGGTLVAEGKAEAVDPNRADDEAGVDIPPNKDPLPDAEADEGANENPEDVPGLGAAPNNNWDWDCGPDCDGSDGVDPPKLNPIEADDPPNKKPADDDELNAMSGRVRSGVGRRRVKESG